jgi:hypothetical protein
LRICDIPLIIVEFSMLLRGRKEERISFNFWAEQFVNKWRFSALLKFGGGGSRTSTAATLLS